MELIALLSGETGKTQVSALIERGEWDSIIIIGDKQSKQFNTKKNFEFIEINADLTLIELKQALSKKLQGKINGTEVALSIASGTGKEHIALISALLSLPVGIRFTALTKQGVVMM